MSCSLLGQEFVLPGQQRSIGQLLVELEDPEQPPALHHIIPFASPARPLHLKPGSPLIMGILNVTPDSFSDGEEERVSEASLEHVLNLAKSLIADGADIIDIGGMSTRPGVKDTDVTMEEEMARVVPVIQALRIEGIDVPISIDTFRAEVAEHAILAGASCINDVRGGREPGMLQVMARLNVPVILMHSRGDSREMLTSAAHDYTTYGGTVEGVRKEMKETVARAEAAGVRSWNIILDPGIGFAKSQEGNLQLLRTLPTLFGPDTGLDSYGVLVGASRKGFIGKVLDQPIAKEREFGNAAVTALCCQSQKVDIVRVHEARPARDVIRMLEAIRES
jgi:dihydroneopterin aldolase/2-amino-4-hydroxy-6-hydroxymethyldihydropteridine diphosphokinase/dihydropteroate synthase